jgi:hypothetical protein
VTDDAQEVVEIIRRYYASRQRKCGPDAARGRDTP